jgi:hypothetical protein
MYKNTLNNILETGKNAFYSAVDYARDAGMKLGMVAALALPVAAQLTTQPSKQTQPAAQYQTLDSCIDPFTEMTSPISPTDTVLSPGLGNFTTSFQKHGSTHRYIGTAGNASHNGYLLEFDGITYQNIAVPLDSFAAGKLQGGAQTIEGYILGAGTDLFEGKIVKNALNQDEWQETALIPLATGNDVMGVATFFYLDDDVEMKDASNNSVGYAVFVALSNNGGIRRVVNTSGDLATIGSSASTYYSLGSVELDSLYCDLDKRLIAIGSNDKIIFKKMRADGTIDGMGVKDIVINIGSNVQGFNFGVNEFTAEAREGTARYPPFTWQAHMLPIPYDTDNDGVPNSIDQCVSVPSAIVDTTGCSNGVGDFDRDGDSDSLDRDAFEADATGPGIGGATKSDLDGDGDGDQTDFAKFQACISGENNAQGSNCQN